MPCARAGSRSAADHRVELGDVGAVEVRHVGNERRRQRHALRDGAAEMRERHALHRAPLLEARQRRRLEPHRRERPPGPAGLAAPPARWTPAARRRDPRAAHPRSAARTPRARPRRVMRPRRAASGDGGQVHRELAGESPRGGRRRGQPAGGTTGATRGRGLGGGRGGGRCRGADRRGRGDGPDTGRGRVGEGDEHRADLHRLARLDVHSFHPPRHGRRDLHLGLVGLDLEERRVLRDHVALTHEDRRRSRPR